MRNETTTTKTLGSWLAPAFLLSLALGACDNPLSEKIEALRAETASSKIVLGCEAQEDITAGGILAAADTAVTASRDIEVRIANKGNDSLELGVAEIKLEMGSGVEAGTFSLLSTPPATLASGASATFTLRFSPQTPGEKTASLTIPTNDVRYPKFNISLKGSGVEKITVETAAATGIATNLAYCSGTVTPDTGFTVKTSGLCWSASGTPTTADSKVETGGGGTSAVAIPSTSLSGLAAGTLYYVRAYGIYAYNEVDRTVYGNLVSFYTLPDAPEAPTATALGYAAGSGKLAVSWSAVTGAAVYDLYCSASATAPGDEATPTASDIAGVSYTLSGLANYSTYNLWVRAKNASGSGAWSASGSGSPGVPVTGVNLDKASLAFGAVGDTAQLVATVSPAEATDASVSWSSNAADVASVSSGGLVTALAAGTATITVTTTNGAKTATCAVSDAAPAAPTAPSVVATSARGLVVTWSEVSLASGYDLMYSTTYYDNYVTIENATSPHTLSGLSASTVYYCKLVAKNAFGSSAASTVKAAPKTSPATPTGVYVKTDAGYGFKINLGWTAVSGASSYTIYRGESAGSLSSILPGVTTTYIDFTNFASTATGRDKVYFYAIKATNGVTESDFSNVVAAIPTPIVNPTFTSYSGTAGSIALAGWTKTECNQGWGEPYASATYPGCNEIRSSYSTTDGWCTLTQTANLGAVTSGIDTVNIQNGSVNPTFAFTLTSKAYEYTGQYYITMELLSSSGATLATVNCGTASAPKTLAAGALQSDSLSYVNSSSLAITQVRITIAGRTTQFVSGQYGTALMRPFLNVTWTGM